MLTASLSRITDNDIVRLFEKETSRTSLRLWSSPARFLLRRLHLIAGSGLPEAPQFKTTVEPATTCSLCKVSTLKLLFASVHQCIWHIKYYSSPTFDDSEVGLAGGGEDGGALQDGQPVRHGLRVVLVFGLHLTGVLSVILLLHSTDTQGIAHWGNVTIYRERD